MELKQLFIDSLNEFSERPSFFIPKLISSLMGSIWMLFVIGAVTSGDIQQAYVALVGFIPVYFVGIWSPVIVAEMVKGSNLAVAVKESLGYISRILLLGIILFGLVALTMIPFYAGVGISMLSGSLIAVILGGLITFLLSVGLIYIIYFTPVTITENNPLTSVKKSWSTSEENRREVTVLIIFSFLLLGLAGLTNGPLQVFGVAGFIFGRLISSVVSTYAFILSPKFYLEAN
jgi:hypothetical protein